MSFAQAAIVVAFVSVAAGLGTAVAVALWRRYRVRRAFRDIARLYETDDDVARALADYDDAAFLARKDSNHLLQ